MTESALRYPIIGVTGMPCSGKSYAADLLADGSVTGEPGELVKADNLGHVALTRPEVVDKMRLRFGDEVFAPGQTNTSIRRKIGERVFVHPEDLMWLESVIHPIVAGQTAEIVEDLRGTRTVVVEAALLLAADMDRMCDIVLLVEAAWSMRAKRAARRGWNAAELEQRDRRLLPLFAPERLARLGHKLVYAHNDSDDDRLGERLREALSGRVIITE